jgi:hypothetical protein
METIKIADTKGEIPDLSCLPLSSCRRGCLPVEGFSPVSLNVEGHVYVQELLLGGEGFPKIFAAKPHGGACTPRPTFPLDLGRIHNLPGSGENPHGGMGTSVVMIAM